MISAQTLRSVEMGNWSFRNKPQPAHEPVALGLRCAGSCNSQYWRYSEPLGLLPHLVDILVTGAEMAFRIGQRARVDAVR
jgi:hypothetical protein